MINRAAIAAASRQLATQPDFLRTTPLMRVSGRTLGVECGEVWLKLEHLQVGGSFKARGMLYRLLANPVPDSGVIIASGGNAGIAVAAAAQALGVRCEVFVPEVSPEAKRARLRALGAEVVVTGAAYSEAFEACVARKQVTGALQARGYTPALPGYKPALGIDYTLSDNSRRMLDLAIARGSEILRAAGPQSRRIMASPDEFELQILWTRCERADPRFSARAAR